VTELLTARKGEAPVTLEEVLGARLVVEPDPHKAAGISSYQTVRWAKKSGPPSSVLPARGSEW